MMTLTKQILFPAAALAMLTLLAPATRPQETAPAMVSVVVRVFDHDQFVSGLMRGDFELTEDGRPQKVAALYEVDKNAVSRQDGESPTPPLTARRFYLLFQMYEYTPKVSEALLYFFENALLPGDTLEIQTPVKNYMLTPQAFAQRPRDVLAKEMDGIVRKDINRGNTFYKTAVRDLRRTASAIEGLAPVAGGDEQTDVSDQYLGLEALLNQYRESLTKLETLRVIDQPKVIAVAQALKKLPGRKFVFYVYQQEFRPQLSPQMINAIIDQNQANQHVLSAVHDLFQVYHPNISLDQKRIVEAYCDSSADLNFLLLTKTPERLGGVTWREQSQDVFKIFYEVATATGGIAESTQNPTTEFRDALKTSEKYYLLFYTPAPGAKEGEFKKITVKVRDKNYKVLNRRGYLTE